MPETSAVAIVGAGAVGSYFGGMLARGGVPVTLIGRRPHVEAIARDGLRIDGDGFRYRIPVAASTDIAAARGADIVLLTVKTPATEDAARDLAPCLGPGAVVASLQNGVDNVERIRRSAGVEALPAVVYVAAAVAAPGRVVHSGGGRVVLGAPPGSPRIDDAARIAAVFARAGVPCRVSDNIDGEQWTKLAMNCAYNAVSALAGADYRRIVASAEAREVLRLAVEETAAVARALGIRMPAADLLLEDTYRLGASMADATSSTAQDLALGRRTEIESLNGYVARKGAEPGLPVPVNRTLYALVRLLEDARPE